MRNVQNLQSTQIYSVIAHHIAVESFPHHFWLNGDWSYKTDFTDALQVGYLCDDGKIAFGAVERQNSFENKIFVHYDECGTIRGKKFEWIQLPNNRLCAPSQQQLANCKISRIRDLSSFYCGIKSDKQKSRKRKNQNDLDMQRAIAASLGQNIYKQPKRQRIDDEDGEDLRRAIAASLGQTYQVETNQMMNHNGNHQYQSFQETNNLDTVNGGGYMDWTSEDQLFQRAIAESLFQQK